MAPSFWPQQVEGQGSHLLRWGDYEGGTLLEQVKFVIPVLVSYCCLRNYPKIQWLKNIKHLLSHSFCDSELGGSLVGCLWLKVSLEVAEGLSAGQWSHLKAQLRLMGSAPMVFGRPHFLNTKACPQGCLMTSWWLAFPRKNDPRERQREGAPGLK